MLFDAVDTLVLVLPALAGALAECTFRPQRMKAALASTMMATDLADHLVGKGATFREAHAAVGRLVKLAEERGEELHTLPLSAFEEAHPLFDHAVFDTLSPLYSVEQREVDGGTGPAAVRAQLEAAQTALR